MKTMIHRFTIPKPTQLLTVAAPAVLIIGVAGCASHGYDQEIATGASLIDSGTRIEATERKLTRPWAL